MTINPATLADDAEITMWLAQAVADGHATIHPNGTVTFSAEFVRKIQEEMG